MKLEIVQSVVARGYATCVMSCATGCLIGVLNLGLPLSAAPPPGAPVIGTAVTSGSFRVDDATVAGNATLFEGASIETRQSSSSLDLASGPRLLLGADSRGRIFGDRLILEKGSGEMHDAAGFRIEARGLTVRTDTGRSAARILLAGNTRVQVAALAGGLRVLNAQGVLVAALNPGMALEFEQQASGEPERLSGCLRVASGHYLVTDEVTNVTVEVAGTGLDKESGNRVQVTGIMDPAGAPVSGATQYVRVTNLKRVAKGCPAYKAAAAGAGGGKAGGAAGNAGNAGNAGGAAGNAGGGAAGGGAAGAGASGTVIGVSVTALAIIGGVAAAAVVGGLAATGALSGSSSPVSR